MALHSLFRSRQYGIEVLYPYDNVLKVRRDGGRLTFRGDFGPPPAPDRNWPPFRNFGDDYYTYQILLDLKPEPGFAINVETHPSFYTDASGTAPIAVPAPIRE